MPHLINGFGTWYVGKSNRRIDRGVCEHCGSFEAQQSYDTTKYVLLLYLPLIPLGKWRVLQECARCKRHGVLKLKEWERQRRDEVREAIAAYEGDPTDGAKAGHALGVTMAYARQDVFPHLATKVVAHLGEDPDTLMALADGLRYFGRSEEAESALRKAHHLRDVPETREALAVHLMRQGKPEAAQELLQHLLDDANPDRRGVLYYLVEAFQVKGDHRAALQVLDAIALVFPETAAEKEMQAYRKVSEKRRATGKPVKPTFLAPVPGAIPGSERSFLGYLAMVIWPVILVGLVAAIGVPTFLAYRSADIYLINGTDRPYAVEVRGEGRILPPGRRPVTLQIPRNEPVLVAVAEPGLAIEPVEVSVETPFWKVLFEDVTRVVNPDRTALVVWEETEYGEDPGVPKEFPYTVQSGKGLYTFEGIDFAFLEFPEEIQVSSSSGTVRRQRIDLMPGVEPLQAFFALQSQGEGKDTGAYLEARVRFDPNDLDAANLLASLDADHFAQLAQSHLESRPVRVDWHRLYQDSERRAGRGLALLETYRGALLREGDNGALLYLAGRIESDPAQAASLFRRAMTAEPPSPYGYHGLAYQRLAGGDFAGALDLARGALALAPDNASFQGMEDQALLALGRYEELLARTAAARTEDPADVSLALQGVYLHVANGDPTAARNVVEAFQQAVVAEAGGEAGEAEGGDGEGEGEDGGWTAYLEGMMAYAQRDREAFLAKAQGSDVAALDVAFVAEDLDTLESLFEAEGATADQRLLAYLLARRAGEGERAEAQFQSALELLQEGDRDDLQMAEWLALPESSGASLPSPETVRWLPLDPTYKAILLAALAERHPRRAVEFRALARRLNYRHGFPRWTLERVLGG